MSKIKKYAIITTKLPDLNGDMDFDSVEKKVISNSGSVFIVSIARRFYPRPEYGDYGWYWRIRYICPVPEKPEVLSKIIEGMFKEDCAVENRAPLEQEGG